uniref:NADH dehydrogenase subunit 2 n=1 Tax=Metorchis orientalis TaxID=674132 RepID=A0A0M4K611_9TREM|nr:NADH dehydrogenase subunit 2 [Metorchis orientalis]ALD61612.1 NADH dehydrogenase subunit 2 [Metorchis orientalis]
MRGVFLSVFGLVCLAGFSVSLFIGDNLLMFWLFLELASLSLIPFFFLYSDSGVLVSLFSYIVISGVSSSLIVSGLLFDDLMVFFVAGLLLKFGLFPFLGWVYVVLVYSNWLVVWGVSTVLKSSFLFFGFILSGGWSLFLVEVCCFLTFLFIGFFFWLYTYGWVYYWCHTMISSSASFVIMSIELSPDLLLYVFLFYFLWASLVILLLSRLEGVSVLESGCCFFLIALLVSFPCSLVIFYKLFVSFCIYSCGFLIFLGWVFCSVSEQFYLIKYLVSTVVPRCEWGGNISL